MNIKTSLSTKLESIFDTDIKHLIEKTQEESIYTVKKFTVEKKHSGSRVLYSVDSESLIWRIQKFLHNFLTKQLQFPDYTFGYQKSKSYFDFLKCHTTPNSSNTFLKLDIKEFFNTISVSQLIETIISDFEYNEKAHKQLKSLLEIVLTYDNVLPQGFRTSPILSNYYLMRADIRIKKYCDKLGFTYSRYADDIIISTSNEKLVTKKVIVVINSILTDFNLTLNKRKTRLTKNELSLNGFVIKSEVRLSQSKLKELRRVLFIIEHNNSIEPTELVKKINSDLKINTKNKKRSFSHEYLLNYLSGNRAFLISSLKNASATSKWYETASSLVIRTECAILKVY